MAQSAGLKAPNAPLVEIAGFGSYVKNLESIHRQINAHSADLQVLADAGKMFSTAVSTMKEDLQAAVTEGISKATTEYVAMVERVTGMGADAQRRMEEAGPSRGGVPRLSPPDGGGIVHSDEVDIRTAPPPGAPSRPSGTPTAPEPKPYGWEGGWKSHSYNTGGLRQDMARKAQEYLSTKTIGPELVEEAGVFRHAGSGLAASEGEIAEFARGTRMMGTLRNVSSTFGTSGARGAIGAALPTTALKFAGGVGAVAQLADQALDFATSQREANRGWQAISGESNASGFGERMRSQMFEWRMKGTMGAGTAEKLYKGVAELGMEGEDRERMLDFATENFKAKGMDIADSLKLMSIAIDGGNDSLTGLTKSLDMVTDAAREGGVNAQKAREAFTASYAAMAPAFGAGEGTAIGAASFQAALARLGPQFQDVQFSPSEGNLYQMASRTGLSMAQFQTKMRGPDGGQFLAQQITEQVSATGALQPYIKAVGEYASSKGLGNTSEWTRRQTEEAGSAMLQAGMDPIVASKIAATYGLKITPDDIPTFLASLATGQFNPAAESAAGGGGDDVTKLLATGEVSQTVAERFGMKVESSKYGKQEYTGGTRAAKEYIKSGFYDPMVERLITDQKVDKSSKFAIHYTDKDGKPQKRVVSFEEAVRYYGDQLATGDVEIVGGKGEGSTVADITGMGYKGGDVAQTESAGEDIQKELDPDFWGRKGKAGKDIQDFEKGEKEDRQKKFEGRIVVEPTPLLKRLLQQSGQSLAPPDSNSDVVVEFG